MKNKTRLFDQNKALLHQINEIEKDMILHLKEVSKLEPKFKKEVWFNELFLKLSLVQKHLGVLKKTELNLYEQNNTLDCDNFNAACNKKHNETKGLVNRVHSNYIQIKHLMLDALDKHK